MLVDGFTYAILSYIFKQHITKQKKVQKDVFPVKKSLKSDFGLAKCKYVVLYSCFSCFCSHTDESSWHVRC